MKRAIAQATALLLVSTSAFAWWDSCDHRADRVLDIDAASLAGLELLASAGELRIEGDPNRSSIEIRGKACTSEESLLSGIQLTQRRDGDRQIVEVVMPEVSGWWSEQVTMDLVVRMPARLRLQLKDSSGDAEITGIASLEASDSSGDLNVRDIGGNVQLNDSSGDLNLRGIGGTVSITDDSSGDINISDVERDAIVSEDSSGSVVLRNIRGDATVTHDSSGDISFEHISGNARVGSDSSGDIIARDVAMAFTVEHDTSGDIEQSNVRGKVTIPAD